MTDSRTDLAELRRRVSEATGADRALDNLIGFHLDGQPFCVRAGFDPSAPEVGDGPLPPNYTASIDAALALVERKIPGATWSIAGGGVHKPSYDADVHGHIGSGNAEYAPTPALALIAALLASLEDQGTGA